MQKPSRRNNARTPLGIALASVLAVFLCLVSPAQALAVTREPVASSTDGKRVTVYYTVDDAMAAGYTGKTIIMDKDWHLSERLTVADSQSITIDMNGHKITTDGGGVVIRLYEKSTLTLTSDTTTTFSYTGYSADSASAKTISATVTTGGLVTGGYNYVSLPWTSAENNTAGGITMDAESTLVLDNVAVAGNYGGDGGGIYTKKKCTIKMKNGASVERNAAKGVAVIGPPRAGAGGIYVSAADTNIWMDNSYIRMNHASNGGGGLFSDADGTRIHLDNNSSISENWAKYGGGLFFNNSYFNVVSDGTGKISDNIAGPLGDDTYGMGGAIYVAPDDLTNEGSIENITFSGNRASLHGGALCLKQEWTTVAGCTFTGNSAGENGGAIYVFNDNIKICDSDIAGTTITGNYCNTFGENYEGGGVYVNYLNDLTLSGTVVVKNNTRGKNGSKDDVFLAEMSSQASVAYLKGGVKKGSSVGVRTGTEGDRRIGKSINNETQDSFFIDLDDYYVSYGTDSGGDMWQRHSKLTYELTVNGKSIGHYNEGDSVLVNGASLTQGIFFCNWSADESSGLDPFSDYVSDIYSAALEFEMPQHDVKLTGVYVTAATSVSLAVPAPQAGEDLPTTATLSWGDGQSKQVSISWIDEKGSVATKADYGASYRVVLNVARDKVSRLFFAYGIGAGDVHISVGDSSVGTQTATVVYRGNLEATSESISIPKAEVTSVADTSLTVAGGTTMASLLASLPSSVTATLADGSTLSVATDKAEVEWPDGLFDEYGKVSADAAGSTLTAKIFIASSDSLESNDASASASITVAEGEALATPQLTLEPGTYTVGSDLALTVTLSSPTAGATVWYSVDGGEATECDPAAGIALMGTANTKQDRELKVWAAKDGRESDPVTATYTLDDTKAKTIEVACSDTALYQDGDEHWAKSFKVTGDLGGEVTVTAPSWDGHVFSHWAWASKPDTETADLTKQALTINDFSLTYEGELTAVYAPVITSIDLTVAKPVAGEELAETATVKAGVGDGETTLDITKYFSGAGGKATLSWFPAADDDGKAAHGTTYTASLSLDAKSAPEGVNYVIVDNPNLLVNGESAGKIAYIATTTDGSKTLCVDFPKTDSYELASVEEPAGAELSYKTAYGYQTSQDAGRSEDWELPKQVKVAFTCGESALLDVSWNKVEGFDKDALKGQTLTATGTVTLPSNVEAGDVSTEVTATIEVSDPEQAATPQSTVKGGAYKSAQSVTLGCTDAGATIRYTTDGSEPTEDSPVYDGEPIEVSETTTIKARAYLNAALPSEVATFEYVIKADEEGDGGKDDDGAGKDDGGTGKDDGAGKDDGGEKTPGVDGSDEGASSSSAGATRALPSTGDAGLTAGALAAIAASGALLGMTGWALRRNHRA